jgi:GNAT superfamily N-acetyltransferase
MQRLLLTDSTNSYLIGYTDFIILEDIKKELNIKELFVYKHFRGKKYGTYILYKLIEMMIKKNVKKIILEDCSKNYGKNNNIYKNLGFYCKKNDSEMELNLENYNLDIIIMDIIDMSNKVNISVFSF